MESKNINEKTINERYVITRDGLRMPYEEYIDMIRSERD